MKVKFNTSNFLKGIGLLLIIFGSVVGVQTMELNSFVLQNAEKVTIVLLSLGIGLYVYIGGDKNV
jgi:hypothetical protein